MITEKEIVYSILNTIRGSHSENNEMISTRLIRSWIASERANLLLNFTDSGRSISEENFTDLPAISFTKDSGNIYKAVLPKIIYLNRMTGIRISHNGEVVSMIRPSQNKSYETHYHLKEIRRAWNKGNTLFLRLPISDPSVSISISAVLFYPSDSSLYSWERDVFPIQSELVNVLKQQVLQKEQLIINDALNDKTNNFTPDAGS